MYYEYWGLKKPPFDNVPDPSMYVDCHASMENAIAETLFAIEDGDECIAVIVGDVGLGKTLSIRMVIDSLEQDKYKIALITNPGISFVQILQEIIGQLTGKQCEEKRKVNLLEIFNRLLFASLEEGKKILIFIDEANAITPVNLESLRLLTNMQGDRRNFFTMVLAGQIEFARRLEHPKRANLFQRVGTYNRIDKLDSVELVRTYVEKRLALAGAAKPIFTEDAFDKIWEHADRGVPRLINKICKLGLKAGETNEFAMVDAETVEQIGSRFHKLTGPVIQKRRSRKRPAEEPFSDLEEQEEATMLPEEQVAPAEEAFAGSGESAAGEMITPSEETAPPEEVSPVGEESAPEEAALPSEKASPVREEPAPAVDRKAEEDATPPEAAPTAQTRETALPAEETAVPRQAPPAEIRIGEYLIPIALPDSLIRQAASSTKEHRLKLAGVIAAETLKKHPELTASFSVDPVPIWQEIRNFVMNRFDRETETASI